MPAKRKNRPAKSCSRCGRLTAKYVVRHVCTGPIVYCPRCLRELINRLVERIREI